MLALHVDIANHVDVLRKDRNHRLIRRFDNLKWIRRCTSAAARPASSTCSSDRRSRVSRCSSFSAPALRACTESCRPGGSTMMFLPPILPSRSASTLPCTCQIPFKSGLPSARRGAEYAALPLSLARRRAAPTSHNQDDPRFHLLFGTPDCASFGCGRASVIAFGGAGQQRACRPASSPFARSPCSSRSSPASRPPRSLRRP